MLHSMGPIQLATTGGSKELLDTFLRGRTANTLEAYKRDLMAFGAYRGLEPADATAALLSGSNGSANLIAHHWRASMLEEQLAPATINRRLAAVRSFVKLAKMLGLVMWTLEVPGVKSEAYRDTRGPGRDVVRQILRTPVVTMIELRDRAIIRLLVDRGLRRGEAVSLDLEHVDLERQSILLLGKGRTERKPTTIPKPTCAVLAAWLGARPECETEAVFVSLDRAKYGHRLTGRSVHRIVGKVADVVGAVAKPHGLRHTAITEGLNVSDGNQREAQMFSRHEDANTLGKYDDNRADLGGQLAEKIAKLWDSDE